jgi:MFS family permease
VAFLGVDVDLSIKSSPSKATAKMGAIETITTHADAPEPATETGNADWTVAQEKALVRKVDLRIFPAMFVLFILNFLDRNNFANARLQGLEEDLGLTDVQYATCISILLVGYVSMQIPSNMLLNVVPRPALYLCSCVASWGVIATCMAATTNAAGAIVCRFFLGCIEAAFFPGSLYLLSRWYTRREMQLRVTILNAGNLAAQAFGGLIAAGILGNMDGSSGIAGWRWLFIIEGVLTIFFAVATYFILPNYPDSTKWLSPEEQHIAQKRLAIDAAMAGADHVNQPEVSPIQGFVMAVTDPKVWLLAATYFLTIFGLCFSLFFPTIIGGLGYDTIDTLLLTAPPWIWAVIVSLPNAWHADRTGERFFHYLGPAGVCIVGYIVVCTCTGVAPRYVAAFLMTTGYASGFVMLAWISNTITTPPAKKAVAIALVNACGNIGSIPGSYIWPIEWGPNYVKSFGIEIAILGSACMCAFTLRMYLMAQNRRLEREELEGQRPSEQSQGDTDSAAIEISNKGFRFLY